MDQTKLERAMNHLQIVIDLIQDNEYKQYMLSKLIPAQIELQRQLTNAQVSTKMSEVLVQK
jgi:3-deoxy-D-arabino-heptulosonate 7-phosphate (DAHP) synthase